MDFIKEDGSFIRIENDRIEGYLSDGTCLFSYVEIGSLPQTLDRFSCGEYEFLTSPGGVAVIRKTVKERDKND